MESETLLLRQIHPSFVQDGRPTSQAFRPTSKDESLLSVEDGSRITPAKSWERYTAFPDRRSAGIMAITFAECSAEQLPVIEDGVPFPEHCSVDFSGLPVKSVERKSKILVRQAIKRDWLFKALQQA